MFGKGLKLRFGGFYLLLRARVFCFNYNIRLLYS